MNAKQINFRFIHAADIHLDSPLKGLSKYEDAPIEKISCFIREAFIKLIDLAIELNVNFIILAGDIFDNESPSNTSRRFFIKQMNRLLEQKINVYLIWGNHDAKITPFQKNELPLNVHCFDDANPESVSLDELSVIIHGQSYKESAITINLAKNYPASDPEKFNIGILHTSLNGNEGHDTYAPCDLEALKVKGYDYWALGHIHKHQILNINPHIIYSGNIQGRHVKEKGEKGCVVVDVEQLMISQVKFHSLDCLRWELLTLDVSSLDSFEDILSSIIKKINEIQQLHLDQFLIIRLQLIGSSALHSELHASKSSLREKLEEKLWEEDPFFWLEKIILETRPISTLLERADGLGDLALAIEEVLKNVECHQEIIKNCQDIIDNMPDKSKTSEGFLNDLINGKTEVFFQEVQTYLNTRLMNLEK